MNKKEYLDKRKALCEEAQKLINEGKAKDAEGKMNEVKSLDAQWDAIAQAQANLAALNNEPEVMIDGLHYDGVIGSDSKAEKTPEEMWDSEVYKKAWYKDMTAKPLNQEEAAAFKMVNEAFTHTTDNTAAVIPKSVSSRIWELAGEMYPYFADVTKTYVNGIFTMTQEDTSSDAKWYDEATTTEDGKEEFKEFQLNGCELSRSITISWKLREMAMEDFIPYIERKLAKKMGAGAGYGVTHGAGPKAASGKPEPMGVVTALKEEENTPQVVTYAKGSVPTYTNITALRAKVKSGYGSKLCVYANTNTIWNKLANILDANKKPIFMVDPMTGGFRILGMPVKEDDSMKNGEILFSNAEDGYHDNINKEMSVMTEEHVKERKTDYCGYAIMDGNVTTTKAHALLVEASA